MKNILSENCTIYCISPRSDVLRTIIASHFSIDVEVKQLILINGTSGSLQISQRYFEKLGDDFCVLLRDTWAFADHLKCEDNQTKKKLLDSILGSRLAVGVVATPKFGVDERYSQTVFSIAKQLNGIIFDGSYFLDSEANLMHSL